MDNFLQVWVVGTWAGKVQSWVFGHLAAVSTWVGELESWVAECAHVGEVG